MPVLQINTNVDQGKFDEAFLKAMTTSLSRLTGKPEKYIMVGVNGNKVMSFGGTTEPCAIITFESIGCIDEEKNSMYAKAIFEAIKEKGIPSDRAYINFHNLTRDHVGWNDKLFSQ